MEKEILHTIMEYAELGDLYSLIKHYKKHSKYFDEIDLWRIASDILSGLEYLHSQNIIHRDIKCLNLFITKDRHIKIGDLGVSTITSGMDNLHYTRVGTPLYISPELVKQKPYDYKTDIWSFGCSLYHLASLEPPFSGGNLIVLGNNIVKGVPKSLPHQYSNELRAYIDKMLEKKPEKRPSAKEALELIPMEIREKISSNGDKFPIKSKRPFSSVMNKIITVNKDEMRNLFGEKNKIKNKHKQNIFFEMNKNYKNNKNKNCIFNSSSGNIITIHNFDKIDSNEKDNNQNDKNDNISQNNNLNMQKDNEIKIKENKKREFKAIFSSAEKEKTLHRNKDNNIGNIQYDSASNLIQNSNNKLKRSKNISVDTPMGGVKKINDLSFNIPSFNNQKGFNNFRSKKKNFDDILSDNKFTLGNKYNSNYNYIKIFSPLFKNSTYFDLKKTKNNHFIQKNVIEPNNNQNNIKKIENKMNTQNTIRNIIEINKNININKNKENNTESNINIINYDNKNINIINIINNNENDKNNCNTNNENNNKEKSEITKKDIINLDLKNDLKRLNTDITKKKSKENIKFPELNIKDKAFNNFIKKSINNSTNNKTNNNNNNNINNNNINAFINSNLTNLSSNRNIYKRLISAKPNARSFQVRPFTSKINKMPMTFNNNINFDSDTFNNIKRHNNNNIMFYTKGHSQTDSHRNYSENITPSSKKSTFRPMTGIKPQINNNVMNININFYNIDMNKRFLIPEINPYSTGNEVGPEGNSNIDQLNEESLLQTKKFKDNMINNMDLQSYKNSNEFLFEKIIKAIKDINGNNKRLTINDLI